MPRKRRAMPRPTEPKPKSAKGRLQQQSGNGKRPVDGGRTRRQARWGLIYER
jgi:hypothetical protein